MKILYDHQIFSFQAFGGVSRYFTQIISHLPTDVQSSIAVKYTDNVYLKQESPVNDVYPLNKPFRQFLFGKQFKGKGRIFERWAKKYPEKYDTDYINKQQSIDSLKKQDFDIFHPTYYDDYFLEYIGNKPFVLTIHDMINELYPELYANWEGGLSLPAKKAGLAHKANHIIAVSERTKKDIIDLLHVPEEKISVIYHAGSIVEKKEKTMDLPSNYFLYLGQRERYKNFMFFIRAIEPVLERHKDIYVVCVGQQFHPNEIKILNNTNIKDRLIPVSVGENDLYEVYNRALAFVFPSYYEGFGIPILEAFEASCPVLLSDSSCFPEIAKDCALYFPPKDIKGIQLCLENIINNPSLRQTLIDKGKTRVKDFSWSNSAGQTYEVYKRVLANE
jgi:glycosyltransferase involved in cell wall biosynthesis